MTTQETWKLFKEADERFKETDEEIKRQAKPLKKRKTAEITNKAVYALTGKWSRFVECLIAPATERLFKERGIEVDTVYQRVKRRKKWR